MDHSNAFLYRLVYSVVAVYKATYVVGPNDSFLLVTCSKNYFLALKLQIPTVNVIQSITSEPSPAVTKKVTKKTMKR